MAAANSILPPFEIFTDRDGNALSGGYVYIGTAGQNPETSAVTVYFDSDLTIPAAQPIRTVNGYPSRNGTPAMLYVASGDYSITVRDRNGSLVFSSLNETLNISSARITFLQSGTGAVATTVQAKLRERVSVKDFGAVGDGVADDTAAFTAALAASDKILVPPGTYLVNNLAIENGKVIQGIGLPTITTSVTFGAFRIVSANHDIVIEGLHFTSSTYVTADRSGVEIGGASANYNITIRNCKFTQISNGIRVNGSPSQSSYACHFHDNLMEDVSIGVQVLGLTRSRVSGNTIKYGTAYLFRGISLLYADECQITGNTIIGNTGITLTGIFSYYDGSTGIYANRDNLIAFNTIRNIKEEGISLDTYNSTGFKYGGTATAGSTNSLTDSGAAWGTNAYVGYYCVIVDGTGKGEYRYITANTGTVLTVSNYFNVAPDATSKYVIVAPQFRNKIIGNIFDNVLREGILLWGNSIGGIVANNSITSCGGSGTSTPCIGITGQKYVANNYRGPVFHNIVTGNTIENSSYVGIWSRVYSDGTPDYQLQGNIIEGNFVGGSGVGVQLDRTENSHVRNNTLANSSTAIKLSSAVGNSDNSITGNKTISCGVNYNVTQTQGYIEFEATAMPASGTYCIGTFALNINPSILGSGGYVTANQKYTVRGWRRITTGSGNVLNTDWVEERVLTGA